jgi:hypothetical protein
MKKLCVCKDIKHFDDNVGKTYALSHLKIITVDEKNWMTLYQCPTTCIFWKKSYPNVNFQGGGEAEFEQITKEQANSIFKF